MTDLTESPTDFGFTSMAAAAAEAIADLESATWVNNVNNEPGIEIESVVPLQSMSSKVLWFLPSLIMRLISFALIYLPGQIISASLGLLNKRVSFTLSFSSLLILIGITVTISWTVIRYKYLTIYSKLPPEKYRQEPKMDIFVESGREEARKSGLANYLDDFLNAIKIFGYLDKKVFHELTKQMRTIKLEEGEVFKLKDMHGFSIVIDGTVEVFAKAVTNDDPTIAVKAPEELSEEFNGERYQLLNNVSEGAPLSSLFSILSLFTQDIQLNNHLRRPPSPWFDENSVPQSRNDSEGEVPHLSLNEISVNDGTNPDRRQSSSVDSTMSPSDSPRSDLINQKLRAKKQQPADTTTTTTSSSYDANLKKYRRDHRKFLGSRAGFEIPGGGGNDSPKREKTSFTEFDAISEDIICRAPSNATIAIIPGEAFRILTSKYPKAASHMVQVILTRCQRVTFSICHNYLGLTPEIFQAEATLNRKAKYELPTYIHDIAIRMLKEQAKANDKKTVILKKPKRTKAAPTDLMDYSRGSRHVVLEPNTSHPGDLLSNVPLSRIDAGVGALSAASLHSKSSQIIKFSGEDETEDSILRTALVESIFDILGFDESLIEQLNYKQESTTSVESSPMFIGLDSGFKMRGSRGSFGSFGSTLGDFARLDFENSQYSSQDNSSIDGHSDRLPSGSRRDSAARPNYEMALQEAASLLQVMAFEEGSVLCKQGEYSPGLYFVIDGMLEVAFTDAMGKSKILYDVKPGGIAGFVGAVVGHKSLVDIKAKSSVYVGMISRSSLEKISEKYPMIYICFAKTLTSVLSRLIIDLDFGLEWLPLTAGSTLFQQGDTATNLYFVLNGRLRGIVESKGSSNVVEEFGNGDSLGELEVLTVSKYHCTLHAIRDSELVRLPQSLFEGLATRYPTMSFEIIKIVAERLRKTLNNELRISPLSGRIDYNIGSSKTNMLSSASDSTYRTISILPVTAGLPVSEFSEKLLSSFHLIGRSAIVVDNAAMLTYLGRHAFNKLGRLKMAGYLADLEDRYQTVIYVADTGVKSPWTRKCITQADCILLIADAMTPPDVGEYEHLLVKTKTSARTDLVLLHPERYVSPGSTNTWLKNRIWVNHHHHVQMSIVATAAANANNSAMRVGRGKLAKLRSTVQNFQTELISKYRSSRVTVYSSNEAHKNDFNRLARVLSGQAVGLVLGGGGARGIAHIGVIRALEDNGIPIDFVGGTSIGAFVGGLYAKEYDVVPSHGRAKQFASRISSIWRMLMDVTWPTTSYTTGHEFNRGIWKAFGDSRIEDFWLRYYNNTTNITHSRKEIHVSGYAWRYIRASMSLAGLLPPITDNGSMLLDGGYVDNLTVSQMQAWGARYIFAVDVGSIDDTTPMNYGDTLSGLWVVLNRWNFFSKYPNVPSMTEIQQRLAYVSSVGELERAKTTPGVVYMRPPIDDFATLDFAKFDEILTTGSKYAHEFLNELQKKKQLPVIPGAVSNKGPMKRNLARRNSI